MALDATAHALEKKVSFYEPNAITSWSLLLNLTPLVVVIAGYLISYALICVTSLTVSSWFVNEAAAYVGYMVFYDNVIW